MRERHIKKIESLIERGLITEKIVARYGKLLASVSVEAKGTIVEIDLQEQ